MQAQFIILTGLGAPQDLYHELCHQLNAHFPESETQVLPWWQENDFGESKLKTLLHQRHSVLIAHSAGGVLALKALVQYPELISQIILLDSHFLAGKPPFPPIKQWLEKMLIHTSPRIKSQVMKAYEPLIMNGELFFAALNFAIEWIVSDFDSARVNLRSLPPKRVLSIGFTDSNYRILDAEHQKEFNDFWEPYGVQTDFIPMNHFDLIEPEASEKIALLVTVI